MVIIRTSIFTVDDIMVSVSGGVGGVGGGGCS